MPGLCRSMFTFGWLLSKRRSKSRRSRENVNVNPALLVTGHCPSPQLSEIYVICLTVTGKFQYCKADLPLDNQMAILKRSLYKHVNSKHTCCLKSFMFGPHSGPSLLILVIPIDKAYLVWFKSESPRRYKFGCMKCLSCTAILQWFGCTKPKNSLEFLLYSVCSLALSCYWKWI